MSHRALDGATEGLIYLMVVFTPWAFGTTEPWSIWTANTIGYLLAVCLLGKWIIRRVTGFQPDRWDVPEREELFQIETRSEWLRVLTIALAALTGVILAYTLISALNARAEYLPGWRRWDYFDNRISWLPQSYDQPSTFFVFWQYLACACFFWALRDWLLTRTRADRRPEEEESVPARRGGESYVLPARLQRLLWVVCLNGGLLALEAILQRLDGTDKLLWLRQPRLNSQGEAQFGPYSYRANAAAYLNLVWPVCLAFWLYLRRVWFQGRRSVRMGSGPYNLLLPFAVLMAASPIVSTSRGGVFVAVGLIVLTMPLILRATRGDRWRVQLGVMGLFLVVLALSGYLGWKDLQPRLENLFVDELSGRTEIFANSRKMAADFPWLGSGPGTFGALYQLYKAPNETWAGYVHDDWLETRITFGWIGLGIILSMLAVVVIRWTVRGGIRAPVEFAGLCWLSLFGVLLHAKFDFPFQIYSIVVMVLLICSILFCLSRK